VSLIVAATRHILMKFLIAAIDLNDLDLHVQPHGGHQLSWFMTMIYSRVGREIDGNTRDAMIFRQV
jgi:hypothetical protein